MNSERLHHKRTFSKFEMNTKIENIKFLVQFDDIKFETHFTWEESLNSKLSFNPVGSVPYLVIEWG